MKKITVTVINTEEQTPYISDSDAEMDIRGKAAVKAAIEKARVCKEPIAKYVKETKKAYIEYANGERKYAN